MVTGLANVAAAALVLATRAAEHAAVEAVQDPQKSPLVVLKVQFLFPICQLRAHRDASKTLDKVPPNLVCVEFKGPLRIAGGGRALHVFASEKFFVR